MILTFAPSQFKYIYLKVTVCFTSTAITHAIQSSMSPLDLAVQIKQGIRECLADVFGCVQADMPFDILVISTSPKQKQQFTSNTLIDPMKEDKPNADQHHSTSNEDAIELIIRAPYGQSIQFNSSLSLKTSLLGKPCKFIVLEQSPFLHALSS